MNVAPAPRAVVFDLDGTLLDSLPLVLAAISYALEPFGRRPTMDIFAKLGGPPARFLPEFLSDENHVPVAMERLDAYHRQNTHLIQPFEGVRALLAGLKTHGVQTAIWTGRDRESAERLLRVHQLEGYFATVVCGDDLPTHKPEPEGLREIMRRLGVTSAETLFVGDADVDVLGGEACGVDTVLIRHNREIEAHISSKSWQAVISPAEAYAIVLSRLTGHAKVTISPSENGGGAEKGP